MTPKRRSICCCLVLALTTGVGAARAQDRSNSAAAPAQVFSSSTTTNQPMTGVTSTPLVTATAPAAPDDYDRLPFMVQTHNETEAEAPSTAGLFARTLGALLLIVGLIAAAAWGLRRFGGAQFGAPAEEAPELAVLATVSL